MDKKINIYVATHKFFDYSICPDYIPIAVGEELNKQNVSYIKDSTGENISDRNVNYCELTALYWIWKNDESDIKGLCHYRRYFTKKLISGSIKGILTKKDINEMFDREKVDVIVSERAYSVRGVVGAYLDCGKIKDLRTTRKVIAQMYPAYLEAFDKCMNDCSGLVGNLMIASKNIFDDYAKWLFDILFEVERNTDISGYSNQEQRVYGYISERLLGVYLEKNKSLVIKRCRILNTEEDKNLRFYVKQILIRFRIIQNIKKIVFIIRKKRKNIHTL